MQLKQILIQSIIIKHAVYNKLYNLTLFFKKLVKKKNLKNEKAIGFQWKNHNNY